MRGWGGPWLAPEAPHVLGSGLGLLALQPPPVPLCLTVVGCCGLWMVCCGWCAECRSAAPLALVTTPCGCFQSGAELKCSAAASSFYRRKLDPHYSGCRHHRLAWTPACPVLSLDPGELGAATDPPLARTPRGFFCCLPASRVLICAVVVCPVRPISLTWPGSTRCAAAAAPETRETSPSLASRLEPGNRTRKS